MPQIELKYGRTTIPFEWESDRLMVLGSGGGWPPLSDVEIGRRFDEPIGSGSIEETVAPGETVLIVVPDATRKTACGQMINLLVRRLIATGVNAFDIRIIFATGLHRKVTDAEKAEIVTPFIAQRIKMLDHDPRDLMQIVRVGETSGGIPIELNRALFEHDHVILIGGVSFHYFAGFTGGRKLICPGLASSRTIAGTHKLAFDCEKLARRDDVDTARLDGNAVHEAFVEAAKVVKPTLAITTVVNDSGEASDVFCGDWESSHRAACEAFAKANTVSIEEKRDLVIVSCGGFPHDINMIQAHKALDAATRACKDAGTIVLLAECADGLGRSDFLDWFEATDSRALASSLCEKYQVNGQTAWSLLKKAENFDIRIMSQLPSDVISRMRIQKIGSIAEITKEAALFEGGFIIANGAQTYVRSTLR